MLLDDKEHLPVKVTNINGIKDILLAIEPELVLIRQDLTDLQKELYVKTTDAFIRRWELDFGIAYDASLTLDQRRQAVLNKLARKKVLNWDNLALLCKNNLAANTQFYIVNDASNFYFKILVVNANYTQLERAIREAKPAYLLFDVVLTDIYRRCGTFNCGTNPI